VGQCFQAIGLNYCPQTIMHLHDGLQTRMTVRQRYDHEVSGGAICRPFFVVVEGGDDVPFPRDASWSLGHDEKFQLYFYSREGI
jgi:hypothetical protein